MRAFDVNFKFPSYKDGIDLLLFAEILGIIADKTELKTIDQISKYDLVYVNNANFYSVEADSIFISINEKGKNFALINRNKIFKITHIEDDSIFLYARTFEDRLNVDEDINILKEKCPPPYLDNLNKEGKQVYNWLENGNTGASSITLARHLYNFSHWKYRQTRDSYPHDVPDFIRCMNFLEEVPDAKERLYLIKNINNNNKEWTNLFNNWVKITELIKNDEREEAYELIKNCVNINKPNLR